MAAPRNVIPRSPAGLLAGPNGAQEDLMTRSASGHSSGTGSPRKRPGPPRRRSTDASGSLDYYWSSYAGKDPNAGRGHDSSSSSLAISPSPSARGLAPSPTPLALQKSRSHSSIGDVAREQASPPRLRQNPSDDSVHSDYDPGPSNRRIHVVAYPSGSVPGAAEEKIVESPGGWSESSHYSNSESAPSRIHGARIDSVNTGSSSYSPLDYRNMYGSQFGEARRGLLEPSTGDYEPDRIERRNGVTSGGTYRGENPDDPDDPVNRTPMAPVKNVMDLQFPMSQYPRQVVSPAQSDRSAKQITPTRAGFSRNGSANPSPRGYTPESGRIALIAPPDLSQRALDALEKEAEVAPGSDRMDVRAVGRDEETQSSPASNGDFGGLKREEEDEDTLKGRNRRTLPATTSSSSGAIVEAALPPRREEMLSPEIYGRQTPSSKGSDENSGSPSPARSPEPPPRSNLRVQHPLPPPESQAYLSMTPRTDSPPSQHDSLPRIINTAYSPEPSPIRLTTAPRRPDRSPERTPSFSGSATLNDLTEMLGGAIDAIGLIDSRDTPPPTVIEPKRDKPDLRLGPLAPAAEVMHDGPITPSSLPVRNMSLEGPSASRPPPIRTLSSSQNDCLTKFGSPTLVKSPQRKSATLVNVASRPWPASMLYGHIKTMKNPGDRAKGYARSINDLAKAETGLREWCAASGMLFFAMTRISSCHAASQVHRPVGRAPSKMSNVPSHGVRSQSFLFQTSQASLTIPGPSTHRRQVSASSEFPMRADSYTAREISQRVIDPADQPTSLPPNLPYPQLQQRFQSGMKQSQSMQSVASGASKKGGFFSHMGRRGGKKESVSLGPPGPAAKKDVRGLAISEPRSTSPHGSIDSNGLAAPRVQPSISAPMGPRGPRMGSYTPPPSANLDRSSTEMVSGRASLDTGLSRMKTSTPQDRASLDGARMGKSSMPATSSPLTTPNEEDVRGMADILPQVERGVLRAYLGRYGEQMQAIGAYLEDENTGRVMRV